MYQHKCRVVFFLRRALPLVSFISQFLNGSLAGGVVWLVEISISSLFFLFHSLPSSGFGWKAGNASLQRLNRRGSSSDHYGDLVAHLVMQ